MKKATKRRGNYDFRENRVKIWLPIIFGLVFVVTVCILALVMTQALSGVMGDASGLTGGRSTGSLGESDGAGYPLVCIDAGHGYDDTGAMHANLNGLDEKDINLDIALRLAALLEKKEYSVFLTRDSDEAPEGMEPDDRGLYVLDPYERCDLANEAGVDLFISIHCNSMENSPSVSGMQLYYTKNHASENDRYAELLADRMEAKFGDRPKVIANPENDSYVVNRLVNAPSVLVETGFITNSDDAARMLSESWRQQMAEALAEGITAYLSGNVD